MSTAAALVLLGLASFVGLQVLAHNRAQAAIEETAAQDAGPDVASWWQAADLWGFTTAAIESRQLESTMQAIDPGAANIAAFLTMIEAAEGTARGGRDPYRTCFGYRHTLASFKDHPASTGEWKGERLPDHTCAGAGLGPGCVSTAAGRYQIIRPTWVKCKAALGLPDFSPASQDKAALYLIKGRRALDDVQAGRFAQAVEKCRAEWASLPGAGYGQPERKLTDLQAAYVNAGGTLA